MKHLFTTPNISHHLTLRLPRWACLRTRLFSSTATRLKETRESPTSTLVFRTTSKFSGATTSTRSFSTDDTLTSAAATAQSSETSDLVASLHALEAKSPRLIKSSLLQAPADSSIEIRSWKMAEVHYYDVPSRFPTLARGLFTREIPGDSQEDGKVSTTSQIVARGYDKFFDIGEVPWTTVSFFLKIIYFFVPYSLLTKSLSGRQLKRILLARIPSH